MSWILHTKPESLPAATPIKAQAGENVIYGMLMGATTTSSGAVELIVRFPIQPSEPFYLRTKTWDIYTECLTFWDVFKGAEIGTTARRKGGESATYVKLQEEVVNAYTQGRVDARSILADSNADQFDWTHPAPWVPSNE